MPDTDTAAQQSKETADLLNEHLAVRSLPRPPLFLLHGESRKSTTAAQFVAPIWNDVVRELHLEGGRDSVHRWGKLLRRQIEQVDALIDPIGRDQIVLEALLDAAAAGGTHGWESEIGDVSSSASNTQPSHENGKWERLADGAYRFAVLDGGGERLPSSRAVAALQEARADDTWQELATPIAFELDRVRLHLEPLEKRREMLTFRLQVIEQVLLEHLALGYVSPLDAEALGQRPLQPPDISYYKPDDLIFLVAAAEVIAGDEKGALSRTIILERADDDIARFLKNVSSDVSWYDGKAKRAAKGPRIGAYREKPGGSGRLGEDDERMERKHFCDVITKEAALIGEAGVKSLDDALERAE